MNSTGSRRRRGLSEDDPWGWFEEIEKSPSGVEGSEESIIQKALNAPPLKTETPAYILEESLTSQQLWHATAGLRPRQPTPEREAFERMLEQNFLNSEVDYSRSISRANEEPQEAGNVEVLSRGTSPFGMGVSKSFHGAEIHVITLQLPKFRVVRHGTDIHAEFLVLISFGSVTYGVWRRHTDFRDLAEQIERTHPNQFRNSILSWKCLMGHS